MFTASSNVTRRSKAFGARTSVMLIAGLVFANLVALVGLGTSARAAGFPDALHYAPMTWERPDWDKQGPFTFTEQRADSGEVAPAAPPKSAAGPARMQQAQPAMPPRSAVTEVTAPTAASLAHSADHHRLLLIVLMSVALATMGGVSVVMFRSLSREIIETESRRSRY